MSGDAKLVLNGHDRFKARSAAYFNYVQPINITVDAQSYVYSFALNPEKHQPSGTCNFSRIDNAILECGSMPASSTAHIYAHTTSSYYEWYGGLAYSN